MTYEEDLEEDRRRARQRALNHPMIGLALGGGVARGFAHIGVLKTLSKYNIYPDIIAGTSIGAVAGGCYLAGRLDEFEEWALSLTRRKIFSYLDFRVKSASLIGGNKLLSILETYFADMKITDLPRPFVAIATDLVTGHEVWLRREHFVDALSASFALPGIFPPVKIHGRYLIDGALVNPVPVTACRALGARLNIAVDLNADIIGKAAKPGQSFQTVAGFDVYDDTEVASEDQKLFKNSLAKRIFRREPDSPSLFGVMVSALNITQDRITRSRLGGDPPDIHIKPYIGHVGLLEFEKAEELIRLGEESVEAAMPEILAAIEVLLPEEHRPKVKIPESKKATDKTPKE